MGKTVQFSTRDQYKPVVYIELPEAPKVLYGETESYFAVNLSCIDIDIRVPKSVLPQFAESGEQLHGMLIKHLRTKPNTLSVAEASAVIGDSPANMFKRIHEGKVLAFVSRTGYRVLSKEVCAN